MDDTHIKKDDATKAIRALQGNKNGALFTNWLFQELGYGKSLGCVDPRQQERLVALHDFSVELADMLK